MKNQKSEVSVLEQIALSGVTGSAEKLAEAKKKTLPGTYRGRIAIAVDYVITKAQSVPSTPTNNILSKAVIAKALVNLSPQAQTAFFDALEKAAIESIGKKEDTVAEVITDADARVHETLAKLEAKVVDNLPKVDRSGKTTIVISVARIDLADSTIDRTLKTAQA